MTTKKAIESLDVIPYIFLVLSFSLIVSLFTYGLNFSISFLSNDVEVSDGPLIEKNYSFFVFFSVCVIAPIFETVIAQYIPFQFLAKFFNTKILTVISALIFASFHPYNFWYFMNAFLIGVIWAVGYLNWKKIEIIHPFWIIVSVHSLKNLLSFVLHLSLS